MDTVFQLVISSLLSKRFLNGFWGRVPKNHYPPPLPPFLRIMAVRFDPRVLSPSEAAMLSTPHSSALPVGRPASVPGSYMDAPFGYSSRDAQGNPPASSANPPPPPAEAYPRPPSSEPPKRAHKSKTDITTPWNPTVWEVAHEMYYWVHPDEDITKRFHNFPKDWLLEQTKCEYKRITDPKKFTEHLSIFIPTFLTLNFANKNSSHQHRLQISTRAGFRNLRFTGYIANISDSPQSRNTSSKTFYRVLGAPF